MMLLTRKAGRCQSLPSAAALASLGAQAQSGEVDSKLGLQVTDRLISMFSGTAQLRQAQFDRIRSDGIGYFTRTQTGVGSGGHVNLWGASS